MAQISEPENFSKKTKKGLKIFALWNFMCYNVNGKGEIEWKDYR